MAQLKPEYEVIEEFKSMALKVVDKFPDVFNGVNPNTIRAVGVTNKEPKGTTPPYEIKQVPMPLRMDNPYDYYVVINMADWMGMDLQHQQVVVFNALCSISPENDGKVVPFDLKDHAIVVRNFGVDYMKTGVPDILDAKFEIKKDEYES